MVAAMCFTDATVSNVQCPHVPTACPRRSLDEREIRLQNASAYARHRQALGKGRENVIPHNQRQLPVVSIRAGKTARSASGMTLI